MEWFRWYHGAVADDKWPLIARRSGQPIAVVVAVWAALLECASQADDRGSVAGFDAESMDALLQIEDGSCQAVYDALSEGKRPRIVDDKIVSWKKRQSDDEGAAERKRLQREREKLEKERIALEQLRHELSQKLQENQETSQDVTPCHAMSQPVTPCHEMSLRTEQRRTEKNINTKRVLNAGARVCAQEEPPAAAPVPEKPQAALDVEAPPSRQPSLGFDQFFDAYPATHRGGSREAQKAWTALEANRALPGLPRLLDALGTWEDSDAWKEQGGRFVPSAAKFLEREYWLKEPPQRQRDGPFARHPARATTVSQQRSCERQTMAIMLLKDRNVRRYSEITGESGFALPAGQQVA